jgi:hypothetical protein
MEDTELLAFSAVARGVAWLDANGPSDWPNKVDLINFDVEDEKTCILTQLFVSEDDSQRGDWDHTLLAAGLSYNSAGALGFDEWQDAYDQSLRDYARYNTTPWSALDYEWRMAIRIRRGEL